MYSLFRLVGRLFTAHRDGSALKLSRSCWRTTNLDNPPSKVMQPYGIGKGQCWGSWTKLESPESSAACLMSS